ncbi:MAG TPA: oxidoreductase [Chitinophaga sp.]
MKKVVLITGASAGMGRETAILLARNGFTVYGAARRTAKMKDLETFGIRTLEMDVASEASMAQGVQQIITAEGGVDVLINNAGFGAYGALEDVSMADARYQLEVNVFGAARLIQLVLPRMREKGGGKIINISSIGGKFATPYGGWYHASKFALEALSDALRNEVKQFGIDVIVIEPGGVKSEWGGIAYDNLLKNSTHSAYHQTIAQLAGFVKKSLDKGAEPAVIARLILQAITARKPRLRYVGGYMAQSAVIARKLLPDRLFDKMIMGQFK